jgi:hypothetical protein
VLGATWSAFSEATCWRLFLAWEQADEGQRSSAGLGSSQATVGQFEVCLREPAHRRELAAAQVELAGSRSTPEMEAQFSYALRLDPNNSDARECLLAGAAWRRLAGQGFAGGDGGLADDAVNAKLEELRNDLTSYWYLTLSVPVPGLGQMVTGRWGWGMAFLLGTAVLAGGGGITYYLASSSYDDYVAASHAGDSAAQSYWGDVDTYWKASLGLWIAAGVVWALNLVDVGIGIRAVREEEATYDWALSVGCPPVRAVDATAALPVLCW